MQVQPELPEFAATRDAVAAVRATTQAAAASYLCTLTATQFERLAAAARSELHRDLLVRVALAENAAELALAATMSDVVAELAHDAAELAAAAGAEIEHLVSEAAGATEGALEQEAPAAGADGAAADDDPAADAAVSADEPSADEP